MSVTRQSQAARTEPGGHGPGPAATSGLAPGETVELELGGMTCSACAVRIQKKLTKAMADLPGFQAQVNFATERAVLHGLPGARTAAAVAAVEAAGYTAVPVHRDAEPLPETSNPSRSTGLLRRLIVSALLTLPLGNLAIVLALIPSLRFPFWDWLCVLIATPVVFWCAWPFHKAAAKNLRHGSFSMDTLVSLGVLAAYLWSVVAIAGGDKSAPGYWVGFGPTPPGADSIYLEVAAGVTTFLLAGRYFEARSRRSAADVLGALAALSVSQVRVLTGGAERVIRIGELRVGDVFVTRPSERLAADGVVQSGSAAVDTSAMTGEPEARTVDPGEAVVGGTVVLDGQLHVTATHVGQGTQLAQLTALAEHAQTRKANVQALVDKIVAVFVPVILVLAVIVLGAWLVTGHPLERAFGAAVSVLIIACPCALGLATPMALMVGVGRGGQLGILIKSQQALESSGRIDTVVLDKTGTVTTGEMTVQHARLASSVHPPRALALLAAAEHSSEHPTGRALVRFALEELQLAGRSAEPGLPVQNFRAVPGRGVRADVDGEPVLVGSAAFLSASGVQVPEPLRLGPAGPSGLPETEVYLVADGVAQARFVLTDTVRGGASEAVAALHRLGLRTVLLSGDRQEAATAVSQELGIDEVMAEVLPADKAHAVADLQRRGSRVAMVGDGINDAAALATANLGLAMVTGTDVAMKSADIILTRRDLRVVADAMVLSRRTLRTIRGNLVWAFAYNIAAVPLAAFGLLNPLIAGAAMSVSSLFVVTNSLRLRNFHGSADPGAPAGAEEEDGTWTRATANTQGGGATVR